MPIETVRPLKTTLCVYGVILCAIREAVSDFPMQCTLVDIEIVKLAVALHKVTEHSASHHSGSIGGRQQNTREATAIYRPKV